MRRYHLTVSLVFILGLSMAILMNFNTLTVRAAPTVHPSINIDGNVALDAFFAGNGTSGNTTHPYVLEDIDITFDGVQNGIKIANTNRHLILDNVNVSEFYQSTLNDKYWKEISELFPQYNSDDADTQKAINHIIQGMKNKYPDQDWNNIEQDMRKKVYAGIT